MIGVTVVCAPVEGFTLAFVSVIVEEGSVSIVASCGVVGFWVGFSSVPLDIDGVGGSVGFPFVVTSISLVGPEDSVGAVVPSASLVVTGRSVCCFDVGSSPPDELVKKDEHSSNIVLS